MSPLKKFKPVLRPRTFAFQMLAAMLTVSLVPLLLLTIFAGKTVTSQLNHFNSMNTALTEKNYISMYEANIDGQVRAIDTELRLVEDAVLLSKSLAESIFSVKHNADSEVPIEFAYDTVKQRFTEKNSSGEGVISVRSNNPDNYPSPEQALDLAKAKALFPLFKSETSRKPNIVSIYYIHPHDGSFFYPEYTGTAKRDPNIPIYALTSYRFYSDALNVRPNINRVAWTKPYFDITPRGWMFTATTPVYDENRVLRGVVAADVTIERFVDNVLDTRFGDENGYALLLDRDHELIAAQQHGMEEIQGLQLATLFSNETVDSYRSLEINGEQKLVFSRSIPTTNWILGYIIPEHKLLEPIHNATEKLSAQTRDQLVLQLSLLGIVAFCLCVTLAFYLRSKVSRPVNLLTGAFAEMGEGQFSTALNDTRTLEFNQLLRSFNRMSSKIRELMEQQNEHNVQLEHKVEQRTEELREINTELEMRVNELMRIEHWRKELLMNISHDLKTPITLIRGYIDAITDGTIPPADTGIYLKRIYEDIQTINQFVRNLNELSLLETRQLSAEFNRLDAVEFFDTAATKWDVYTRLAKRPFSVARPQPSMPLIVNGDKHLIGRVIDNLIDNALKYSDADCPIVFALEHTGEAVIFRVIDAGAGIPEDALPFIFNSFYRVDKSRNSSIPGSGLGLSIAKEIADIHGGELTVMTNEAHGSGCIFSLSLPLQQPAVPALTSTTHPT
ncbi:ATP-binding response regulator [Paenibacillus harenae]|uniref:histidine kinase n=1 Tax=Paenibacillus harenae TaxID=306543 RepID=A0ABT9U937_PAEHA|nr:sensor histidine kinase [Paenibacillus harenae]MDQ0114714.1 signal transduction histidine kinase [Paenibacillus harenae]